MYKHAKGFRGTGPSNFKPKTKFGFDKGPSVGPVPPGGFPPPPKGKRKRRTPLNKKKLVPLRSNYYPGKASGRMKGVVVERKGK
jgi:hypothetical protein